MSDEVHRYRAELRWEGTTAQGYEDYDRAHEVSCPPARHGLSLSSDQAFRGDPACMNPEQLLLAAASSCQLLSFLAVAARARIDVRGYTDEAEALMPMDQRPVRITEIALRPSITVAISAGEDPGDLEEKVRHLVDVAHRHCFIANSLSSDVRVEPEVSLVTAI